MTGTGTALDPFVIYDVNDLQNMNLNKAAYYKLNGDIDASATSGWNGGLGFVPVGQFSVGGFTGHLDGQGHTIDQLFINRPLEIDVALFGYIANGFIGIQDVTLTNVDITGQYYMGALTGECGHPTIGPITNCHSSGSITALLPANNSNFGLTTVGGLCGGTFGNITNCSSSCTVTATNTDPHDYEFGTPSDKSQINAIGGLCGFFSEWNVTPTMSGCSATGDVVCLSVHGQAFQIGGLVGDFEGGIITNSHSTGNVTVTVNTVGETTGGLVGFGNFSSGVSNCYSTSNISVTTSIDAIYGVAGLIGACGSIGTVSQCYSTGNVTVNSGTTVDSVGGSMGDNYGDLVTDCYARSNVSVTAVNQAASLHIGGFIGWEENAPSIDNCYSEGTMSVGGINTKVGGFSGVIDFGGAANNCFWDVTIGYPISAGGTGETTANMKTKSTFTNAGWDFTLIWGILPGDYPVLGPTGVSPTVTIQATTRRPTTAVCNGTVTAGDLPITEHGVCYSLAINPTTADAHTSEGAMLALGSFSTNVTGLTANILYHFRTYATNASGTSYSADQTPAVADTYAASGFTPHTALLNGKLVNDGGLACFTNFRFGTDPTMAAYSSISSCVGPTKVTGDVLSVTLPGLNQFTTYYYQTEALNLVSISLGPIISFKTKAGFPKVVTGPALKQENFTHFAAFATLVDDGGEACSVGIQWVLDDLSFYAGGFNPVFNNTKYQSTGLIPLTAITQLTGLITNKKYYYRAIATNSNTTVYGDIGAFYTFENAGGGTIPGLLPPVEPPPILVHVNPNPGPGIVLVSQSPVPWTPGSPIIVVIIVDESGPGITEVAIVDPGPGIPPIAPPTVPPVQPPPIDVVIEPNPGPGIVSVSMSTKPWTPGSDIIPVLIVTDDTLPGVVKVTIVPPGPGIPPIIPSPPPPIDIGKLLFNFVNIGIVVGAGSAMTALVAAGGKKRRFTLYKGYILEMMAHKRADSKIVVEVTVYKSVPDYNAHVGIAILNSEPQAHSWIDHNTTERGLATQADVDSLNKNAK